MAKTTIKNETFVKKDKKYFSS